MKLNFGSQMSSFGKTVRDIEGFARAQRFIILSEVSSKSIPNILDMFFGLFPGGTDYVIGDASRTRVMVINTSEVYGTYYGLRDSRTRNVFIHHGMCHCKLNEIQGDTPVIFTDVDWNVISDCPDAIMIGKKNGSKYSGIGEVNVSYDNMMSGDTLFRQNNLSSKEILIPSPEFYEEKDMVLISDKDESYYQQILDSKENMYVMNEDEYAKSLYTLKLNDLIDSNTKICKLNIKVENLSSINTSNVYFEDFISEVCARAKYALEKYGFSGGEFILDGKNGYNINNLKSYLSLSNIEKCTDYMCLCGEVDQINESLVDDLVECSCIMTISHANVNIKLIDKYQILPKNGQTMTDSNVLELSNILKSDMRYDCLCS